MAIEKEEAARKAAARFSTDPHLATMTASDCYRFCLSNPHVDLVLTGPKNRRQLQENLSNLREKGPLSAEENHWIRNFGQIVHRGSSRFSFRF